MNKTIIVGVLIVVFMVSSWSISLASEEPVANEKVVTSNALQSDEKSLTDELKEDFISAYNPGRLINNPSKAAAGYIGYIGSAGITALTGGILLAPVAGVVGSSLAVYWVGDLEEQQSSFTDTMFGATRGTAYGAWMWLLSDLVFLYPVTPTNLAIAEYNKHAQPLRLPVDVKNAISIDPLRMALSTCRVRNRCSNLEAPFLLEYEYNFGAWSLGATAYYLNQQTHGKNSDWFDGEVFAQSVWQRKNYEASIQTRWYPRGAMSGWYLGFGGSTGYSFVKVLSGNGDIFKKYDGSGYYVSPYVEGGYHLNLYKNFSLKGGLRSGKTFSLGSSGSAEHLRDIDYNNPQQVIFMRAGVQW